MLRIRQSRLSSRVDWTTATHYCVASLNGLLVSVSAVGAKRGSAAITEARRLDLITPVLRQLHWLPVRQQIDFWTCAVSPSDTDTARRQKVSRSPDLGCGIICQLNFDSETCAWASLCDYWRRSYFTETRHIVTFCLSAPCTSTLSVLVRDQVQQFSLHYCYTPVSKELASSPLVPSITWNQLPRFPDVASCRYFHSHVIRDSFIFSSMLKTYSYHRFFPHKLDPPKTDFTYGPCTNRGLFFTFFSFVTFLFWPQTAEILDDLSCRPRIAGNKHRTCIVSAIDVHFESSVVAFVRSLTIPTCRSCSLSLTILQQDRVWRRV